VSVVLAEEQSGKEDRILDSAQKLFARYGLRKTSVEDIAKHAGLGKGTIYLYFKSKEEIFEAVCRSIGRMHIQQLEEEVGKVETPTAKLRQFIVTRLHFLGQVIRSNELSLEVFDEAVNTPAAIRMRQEFGQQQITFIRNILEAGIAAGELQSHNCEYAAMAIYLAIEGLDKPLILDGQELGLDDKVEALVDLFLLGLQRRDSNKK
jgi:AcrR family transcriptional regulator